MRRFALGGRPWAIAVVAMMTLPLGGCCQCKDIGYREPLVVSIGTGSGAFPEQVGVVIEADGFDGVVVGCFEPACEEIVVGEDPQLVIRSSRNSTGSTDTIDMTLTVHADTECGKHHRGPQTLRVALLDDETELASQAFELSYDKLPDYSGEQCGDQWLRPEDLVVVFEDA